ncbi:MAG: hypothetical protein ACP5OG_04025 [Candidatus Nanoarchaeia archaeon]
MVTKQNKMIDQNNLTAGKAGIREPKKRHKEALFNGSDILERNAIQNHINKNQDTSLDCILLEEN